MNVWMKRLVMIGIIFLVLSLYRVGESFFILYFKACTPVNEPIQLVQGTHFSAEFIGKTAISYEVYLDIERHHETDRIDNCVLGLGNFTNIQGISCEHDSKIDIQWRITSQYLFLTQIIVAGASRSNNLSGSYIGDNRIGRRLLGFPTKPYRVYHVEFDILQSVPEFAERDPRIIVRLPNPKDCLGLELRASLWLMRSGLWGIGAILAFFIAGIICWRKRIRCSQDTSR